MDARTTDYALTNGRNLAMTMDVRHSKPVVLVNHMVEASGQLTGITRYAFGLIEALVQRDNARYVLATTWKRDDLPPGITAAIADVVTLDHVRSTPLSFLHQYRGLRALAKKLNPDFLYAVNPMCPALPGIPSLSTVHDLYYDVMPELYRRRHRLWWASYFMGPARFAHTIACVSENTARDLVRFHPHLSGRTALVPGAGVLPLPSASAAPVSDTQPYVLLLGNVTPNKNVGFFVDALKLLHAEGRPVRAIHVGRDHSGELSAALSGAPAGLLEIRGGLDDASLDMLMRQATALIQPSLYEGFGLPIIEAHERGVPVIASDIAIFREVAGKGAVYARLGNTAALADAIHRLMVDPAHRRDMAAAALENATRYSWHASAAAAEQIVEAAIRA